MWLGGRDWRGERGRWWSVVWTDTSIQGRCLVRLQKISCTVVPHGRLWKARADINWQGRHRKKHQDLTLIINKGGEVSKDIDVSESKDFGISFFPAIILNQPLSPKLQSEPSRQGYMLEDKFCSKYLRAMYHINNSRISRLHIVYWMKLAHLLTRDHSTSIFVSMTALDIPGRPRSDFQPWLWWQYRYF